MAGLFPSIILTLLLLGIFALATLFTSSLRTRFRQEQAKPSGRRSWFSDLLACTLRSLIVLLLSGLLYAALRESESTAAWIAPLTLYLQAWMLLWAANLTLGFVEGGLIPLYHRRGRVFPVPELLRNLVRGTILLAVSLVILKYLLQINVGPLLASTALLTVVVGFALQGVLGNLLAGMSLHLVRSVMPGDWVALETVEGEVLETNWRESRLRTVGGHVMIIPNSRMASAIIHNMTSITPRRCHRLEVRASFSDAPGEVLEALLEAAKSVPQVLADPSPSALVAGYRDFGIEYRLSFWSDCYYDRNALEGDVGRMIWYQFKRCGIEIPFPMSDQLLNDFMAVVFRQRRQPPEREAVCELAAALRRSDLVSTLLVDDQGKPLLTDDDLDAVAGLVQRVRYTRGETVFRQGESGQTCYVVVRGKVCGRVEHNDTPHAAEFELKPGALFGEMSLITGMPRTATITVPGEVELIEIGEQAFCRILSFRPDIPEILAGLVAKRAATNVAALQRLKEMGDADVAQTVLRESILGRFLRLLRH